jgi:polysaccharide pyruvyl transferase WcaK-like protein
MRSHRGRGLRVAVFGPFGITNFGNESTLQALLHHLRRFDPEADVTCICIDPGEAEALHDVDAVPIAPSALVPSWTPRSRLPRFVRRITLGIVSEAHRWIRGFAQLRRTDVLVVPGTGLLTDMNGLLGFGPYSLFRWSLLARLCGCRVVFVSVGAGPLSTRTGRLLVRTALSLAHYRSYRDEASKRYVESIGFRAGDDPVYPDLVFSPPPLPSEPVEGPVGRVVGLGVMVLPERVSSSRPRCEIYQDYIEKLALVAEWLLGRGYSIRLLSGDIHDVQAKQDLRRAVSELVSPEAEARLIDEPIATVDDLVSQIRATDLVIVSRFHNVVKAILCKKPVIALASHAKSESLMRSMGLADYCLDVDGFSAGDLIRLFRRLEEEADELEPQVERQTARFRRAVEAQYEAIFAGLSPAGAPDAEVRPAPVVVR